MAISGETSIFACTYEFLFYNENYQTGVYIVYEFLVTNSGLVDKYKIVDQFWESKYKSVYWKATQFEKVLLMIMDFIYAIGVLVMTISMLKIYVLWIWGYFKYKIFVLYWYEIIDSLVIIFSIITLSFWAKIVVFPK